MRRRGYDDFCVLLINGLSGSGKTTFEDMVDEFAPYHGIAACKYSVVEPIKSCLMDNPVIGCDEHDERTREFIANCYESDKPYYLRLLTERIIMAANDPIGEYSSSKKLLMVDMRELQDILTIKKICRLLRIQCYRVWIDRPGRADDILDCDNFTYPTVDVELAAWRKANDPQWNYDIIVENNGGIEKLSKLAESLLISFDDGRLQDVLYLGYDPEPCEKPGVDQPCEKSYSEETIGTKVLNWYDEEDLIIKNFAPDDDEKEPEENSWFIDGLKDFRLREPKEDDKFKPGDTVIVRKPDDPNKYDGGWIPQLKQYVGKAYTVSGYFKNSDHQVMLEDEIWAFDDRYLDLVTEDNVDTSDSESVSVSANLRDIGDIIRDYWSKLLAEAVLEDSLRKGD